MRRQAQIPSVALATLKRPPPRRQVLRQVVVEHDGEQREDHHEPDLQDALLDAQREVAPRDRLRAPSRNRCPPSRTGIGSRLKMPSCSEIAAMNATQRHGALARRLARELGDVERPRHGSSCWPCRGRAGRGSESVIRKSVSTRRQPSTKACFTGKRSSDLGKVAADLHADLPRRRRTPGGARPSPSPSLPPRRYSIGKGPGAAFFDGLDELREDLVRGAVDRLSGHRQDDVAGLQSRLRPPAIRRRRRRAGRERTCRSPAADPRAPRSYFDSASASPCRKTPLPPALDLDVELLAGVHAEDEEDVAPARRLRPSIDTIAVSGLEARGGAGRAGSTTRMTGGSSS